MHNEKVFLLLIAYFIFEFYVAAWYTAGVIKNPGLVKF